MPRRLYICFLGLLAAAPPLATDMYLPAIPSITQQWQVETSQLHLSLVLWFVAYSVTLMVWGSLSDRFGRRPILLTGLALFTISSLLCGLSQNVMQLIAWRILQGTGAAGASSMVMAIARDQFEGKERQRVLAWIGVILGVAPMVAPSIGAAIMQFASWRWIFVMQATLSTLTLVLALVMYRETALALEATGVAGMFQRYGRLAMNRNFIFISATTAVLAAPLLGFVAFSPIAFMIHFGMNEQQFALLFGANAICVILGSVACTKVIHRYSEFRLLTIAFVGCCVGGGVILVTGNSGWPYFSAGMALYSFFFGLSRPLVTHLVLEQVDRDIGAASSVIVCQQFLCGACGMAISTYHWDQPFVVFGILATVSPLVTLACWPWILRWISHPVPSEPQAQVNRVR
ncbi:Multidrug resistance protein MdtL [Rubripirellula lacrimiformis]|uniref:Multidrug resistance protein MdtL n=1 Tax=Rubripirellula lacrimiformis TaxID=1930273 RepID=A0A517NAH5_9BACT|nr:multidrug effflux MFS transporter [Rubripirellula lacrimiformis]QDT04129.1 Multidrug resistance protein MdtL [Rubripirellula lacrimiformis]